jgi:hypothetical protein
MNEEKSRLLVKQVWCMTCFDKQPPVIKKADFLIPVRANHYDLSEDGFTIDHRVIGICKKCLKNKNHFQKSNTEPVDFNHKHIVQWVSNKVILNKEA